MTTWNTPDTAPAKPGSPINLRVRLEDGEHEAEGHVTEEGNLWVPWIAFERNDPRVIGWMPANPST